MDKAIFDEALNELQTINDMLRFLASQFTAAELYFGHGTDNPWDEAVALVTQLLHLPPDAEKRIGDCRLLRTERQAILQLASQRISERKPLPYLLHSAWFGGHEFYVDERVLIPRSPFAELLANNLEPYVSTPPKRILDMCTGSGCIAIVAAMTFPEAEVDAVDISTAALEVADENIHRYQLSERVFPLPSDLFDELPAEIYDVILANPPFAGSLDYEQTADNSLTGGSGNDSLLGGDGADPDRLEQDIIARVTQLRAFITARHVPAILKEDLFGEGFELQPEMGKLLCLHGLGIDA